MSAAHDDGVPMRMARAEGYCFAVQTSKEEGSAVDLALSAEDRDLQERAREFTARYLLPFEDECERNDGLSADSLAEIGPPFSNGGSMP